LPKTRLYRHYRICFRIVCHSGSIREVTATLDPDLITDNSVSVEGFDVKARALSIRAASALIVPDDDATLFGSSRKTLVFYRDCRATGVGGAQLDGAVTIEPLEVSLWRGGCGGLLWDFNQAGSVVRYFLGHLSLDICKKLHNGKSTYAKSPVIIGKHFGM
jgi:hypothetical protein